MKRACGKLGIRLLYAGPYNPEVKGKQERYNQKADAFLPCKKRKVDKASCISFCSQKYEVELGLSMFHRDVVYDPADISTVTIECEGFSACQTKPLVITGHAVPKPKLPAYCEKTKPQTSRLLDAVARKNEECREIRKTPFPFPAWKWEASNV